MLVHRDTLLYNSFGVPPSFMERITCFSFFSLTAFSLF